MSRGSSEVIDSKVVEMSLENTNFERNATTSISTLQKLKEALNFTTSKDGMDKFNSSLKKVDFNPLATGIDTAKNSISALDAVSFGFFSKIGAQIEQTTQQYAAMFTSKPIQDGFREFELKMGSVQTILMGAHTKEGLPVTLDMVNQKLDELNTYADKTIYSFSDMTSNIGKFTNAGVDLDTAVAAIQGISNEAALAGANSQQASHAMYNFAQALSAGYVKLIDWKSIENANMATVEFKQTLIDTALELGTIRQEGDDYISTTTDMNGKVSEAFNAQKAFNDSLSAQWMTTDVLTTALAKYSDETSEIGKKAFQAATEVKTFTQLMDTLQEAAGSGWARTWELIIGDFDESKQLFTMLSNTFGSIIDAQAEARNTLLQEGLGEPVEKVSAAYFKNLGMNVDQLKALSAELIEVGKAKGVAFDGTGPAALIKSLDQGWLSTTALKTAMESLNGTGIDGEGMAKSLDEMNEAADRVIKGDFGNNMAERIEQLNKEGFDGEKIQEYVNELHRLAGGTWNITDAIREEAAANVGLNETMSTSSGLFDDILSKVDSSKGSGKKTGRQLLFEALTISLRSLGKIMGEIKGAFEEVFPPATSEMVYKIAEGINKAAKAFRLFQIKHMDEIRTVALGVFKAFDLVLRVGKQLIKSVFKGITGAFKGGGGAVGSFIVKVAELVSKFHDWIVANEIIEKTFAKIEGAISTVVTTIGSWISAFTQLSEVQSVITSFGETFSYIYENFPQILDNAKGKLKGFTDQVSKTFSTAKTPKEFFDGIKKAFHDLWADITDSQTFSKIKESFGQIGVSVKSFFDDLGTNEDGTRNTFGNILDAVSNFKEKMGHILSGVDENGEKIDLFKSIKEAFQNLWNDISISGIIEDIKSGLQAIWTAVDDFFSSLGTDEEGNLNTFGRIWEAIKNGFIWIYDKAIAAKQAIHDFFEEYHIGEFFSNIFGDISTAVITFFTSLPGFVSGAKAKFGEFIEKVKGLGGIKFENLGDIWKAFKDTVGKYFKDNNVFKPITDAFASIKDKLVDKLKEFGVNVVGIRNKIVNAFRKIKDAFQNFSIPDAFQSLIDFFTKKKDGVSKGAKTFGDVLVSFFSRVFNWVSKIKSGDIMRIIAALLLFKGFTFIINLVKPIEQLISALAAEKEAKANFLNKAAMLEWAAAIGVLAYVVFQLSKLSIPALAKGIISLGLIMLMAGLFSVLTTKFSDTKGLALLGAAMLEIAASIGILVAAIYVLGKLLMNDWQSMAAGLGGLVAIMVVMGIVMKMMENLNGVNTAFTGGGMLMTVISLYGLLLLVQVIAKMPLTKLATGLAKVFLLGGILAAIMLMMKHAVGDGLKVSIGIAGLAAAILAIAAALWILSSIKDTGRLMASVAALGLVMIALMGVVYAARGLEKGLGVMIGIAAVILALGATLIALSFIDADLLVGPTLAIVALLGMVALVAGITGALKPAMTSLLMMVILVGIVGAVLLVLSTLPNPDAVAAIATGLGIVFAGLAVAMLGAVTAGSAAGPALIGLGVMLLFVIAFVALAALIGKLAGDSGMQMIQNGIEIMVAVFEGLGRAIGSFISGLMTAAWSALPAVGEAITGFMQALAPLNDIGMVDPGPFLEALGMLVGASVAGLIDGLASTVTELTTGKSSVQLVADDMAALADGFAHYAEVMTQFDDITIDTTALDNAILEVTKASLAGLVDGLATLVTDLAGATEGESSVALVAEDMGKLAEGFSTYATTMQQFEGISIDTTNLDNAIGEITKASLAGLADGLATLITDLAGVTDGESSVQMVAEDMSALASGFTSYATAMTEFDGITIDTTNLDSLIETIGEISFQGLLTSLGSLLLGDDDKTQVEQFSEDIGTLASALVDWQAQMAPLEGLTVPTDDITKLKEALDTIKEGGILDSILGFFGVDTSPDYSSFNEGIVGLGGAINEFANSLGEDFDEAKLNTATDAIKKLSEVGVALGKVDFGGWFHEGVLTTFAKELVKMAPKLDEFAGQFTDTDKYAQIALATKQLATGASGLSAVKFGNGDLTNSEVINQVKANIDILVGMIEGLNDMDISGVGTFTGALDQINNANLQKAAAKISEGKASESAGNTGKDVTKSITDNISSDAISTATSGAITAAMSNIDVSGATSVGLTLGTQIGLGILRATNTIKTAAQTVARLGSDEVAGYKSKFYSAGRDFSVGLGNGIRNNSAPAINAAVQVAADALAAAKRKLDEHSPSKEAAKIGMFFDLGLAKGINDFGGTVYTASEDVASMATEGLKSALESANDILTGDDYQPTITPVLDLSEIQLGAGQINDILATSPAIAGNLGAISVNADAMRETANTSDILNALEMLGSSLGGKTGDTYVVNGVTYDDGTNVSDAVRSLIRAAKVERRA